MEEKCYRVVFQFNFSASFNQASVRIRFYFQTSFFFIGERMYEKTDYFTKPIKEVIDNSKKEIFTYNSTNIWGTILTLSINKSEFLEIIDRVKRKIKEHNSMVIKDVDRIYYLPSFISLIFLIKKR